MNARCSRLQGFIDFAGSLCALAFLTCPLPGQEAPVPQGSSSAADITELSLEELSNLQVQTVYGASKHDQKVSDAPAAVSVVTAEDIRQYGYRTLADVLNSVRGFYVGYDRNYSTIGMRGVRRPDDFGGRILLTVDGHRVNDPFYNQSFAGQEFPLDVDLIERVEIIRGPGSAIYGNNAFFSVINVITRRGAGLEGVESSGAVSSFDTYSGRITYGDHLRNGLEWIVSGTLLDSAGHERLFFPEQSAFHQGWSEHLDREQARKLYGSIRYGEFTLTGMSGYREKHDPTAVRQMVFNQAPNQFNDERDFVEGRWEHEFARDWTVDGRAYYDRYSGDWVAPEVLDPLNPSVSLFHSAVVTDSIGGELRVVHLLGEKHRVTLGLEGRQDVRLHGIAFDESLPTPFMEIQKNMGNMGAYLQDEFAICPGLNLQAGVRYDYHSEAENAVNPRTALIYQPWSGTSIKLLYGEAYRAPNQIERIYRNVVTGDLYYNADLRHEEVSSYEVVWEQILSKPFRFTTSLFYQQTQDLISSVDETANPAVQAYVYRNVLDADLQGVEMELEGQSVAGFRGHISYALVDAFDHRSGARLSNSPEHVGKAGLAVPVFAEKLALGMEVQVLSARTTALGNQVPGMMLAHLTVLSRELAKGLDVSVSIYNVFNRKYREPVGLNFFPVDAVEQDGRSFRAKLAYRF